MKQFQFLLLFLCFGTCLTAQHNEDFCKVIRDENAPAFDYHDYMRYLKTSSIKNSTSTRGG